MAIVSFWSGIACSVIGGLGIFDKTFITDADVIIYFIVAIVGSLFSWGSSLLIYGFGQLIENTEKHTEKDEHSKKELLEKDIADTIKKYFD